MSILQEKLYELTANGQTIVYNCALPDFRKLCDTHNVDIEVMELSSKDSLVMPRVDY
jgi:hypothetical protein